MSRLKCSPVEGISKQAGNCCSSTCHLIMSLQSAHNIQAQLITAPHSLICLLQNILKSLPQLQGVASKNYKSLEGEVGNILSLNVFFFTFDFNRTIAYSVSKTRFFVGKPPFFPVVRELPITNTFNFNMIIYDAAFPADVEDVFSVSKQVFPRF